MSPYWSGIHVSRIARFTIAPDKAYDTKDFVQQAPEKGAVPHVAQKPTAPAAAPSVDATTPAAKSASGSGKQPRFAPQPHRE